MYTRVHFYFFFKKDSLFISAGLAAQVSWDESCCKDAQMGTILNLKEGKHAFVNWTYRESHQEEVCKLYLAFIVRRC